MNSKAALTPFLLTMVILSTILSIKNWPFLVEYQFSSLIYLLIAAVFFFIPVSFVSAELASGWPEKGGIYVWVKEALGEKYGFLSIWFLWISNVVWYPTILSFIASTLAYTFSPELANNPTYTISMMLGLFWLVLIGNFLGIRYSGWFGTATFLFGTLVPGAVLIALAGIWLMQGNPSQIDFSWGALWPKETRINEWIYLVGVILSFTGMEMNAIHARDVANPRKNFPRVILLSTVAIIFLTLLGTFSIGIVLPKQDVNLVTAVMEAFRHYLAAYQLSWLLPVFALMIAFGAMGGVSSWLVGSSRGLLFTADKHLPKVFSQVNRHQVPVFVLLLQGIIVTIFTLVFTAMPNLSSAFWILITLSSQLYLIMYMLMFVSAILLRMKKPDVERGYKIPFGNVGMFAVSGLGLTACFFCFFIGFIPPAQMETGSVLFYETFLVGSVLAACAAPFLFMRTRIKQSSLLTS